MTEQGSERERAARLAAELREALDDPKRGEWGGYPWEHLGDAERDVRLLLDGEAAARDRIEELEHDKTKARDELAAAAAALGRARLALTASEASPECCCPEADEYGEPYKGHEPGCPAASEVSPREEQPNAE